MKQNKPVGELLIIGVCALAATFALCLAILAWSEPGSVPPNGGVAAPINTGASQTKAGDLTIGGGLAISSYNSAFALKASDGTMPFVVGQDGNIGIGTLNPAGRLDVEGGMICLNGDCCSGWEVCFKDH